MFDHLVSLMRNELRITNEDHYTTKEEAPTWL